jgi:ArsR family transcriptional regulator
MDQIDDLLAETLKSIAHPRRLRIIHILAQGPREVARLAADLGISQPNTSQHLAVLRTAGLVEAERVGREVRYRLVDPGVTAACSQMRRVLGRRLDRLAALASDRSGRPNLTPNPSPLDEVARWTPR